MRIKLGIAGIPLSVKSKGLRAGILELARLGLNAMEIQFVRNIFLSPGSGAELAKFAAQHGIQLSIHAPYYINLCGAAEVRSASISRIAACCQIASAMESEPVVFHPGYYGKLDPGSAKQLVFQACSSLAEYRVKLGLETMGKQSQFGSLDEILELASQLEHLVPVLDLAHIHSRGNGCLKSKEAMAGILTKVEDRLGLRKFHIHFTEVDYANFNERKHLPLGKGDLNFEQLARVLIQLGYEATIICESPLLEQDALKMKHLLEQLSS